MVFAVVYSGSPTPAWYSTVAGPAIALMGWAVYRARDARSLSYSATDVEYWRSVRKLFWIDVATEWGLLVLGGLALAHLRRLDLVPQLFGIVVGLHMLPLATVFRAPRCYWTGGIMVAGALGSLLIARGNIRNIIGCAAVGLTLWISGVSILSSSRSTQADGRTKRPS
jgi:hypothetical protein